MCNTKHVVAKKTKKKTFWSASWIFCRQDVCTIPGSTNHQTVRLFSHSLWFTHGQALTHLAMSFALIQSWKFRCRCCLIIWLHGPIFGPRFPDLEVEFARLTILPVYPCIRMVMAVSETIKWHPRRPLQQFQKRQVPVFELNMTLLQRYIKPGVCLSSVCMSQTSSTVSSLSYFQVWSAHRK